MKKMRVGDGYRSSMELTRRRSSNRSQSDQFTPHYRVLALALCAAAGMASKSALAASGNWLGTADDTWAGLNWSTTPVPGTGDSATFNGAGNGNIAIDLGAGVTIKNILFDTSGAAAYNIGAGAVGSQLLTINDGGAITVTSTVTNNELFNAAITLGLNSTAQAYSFTNNSPDTVSFAGNITGGSTGVGGVKTLTIGGSGNTVFSGNFFKGTPTSGTTDIALSKIGAGTFTVNSTANVGSAAGAITVNQGTLAIDFTNAGASSSLLSSFSALTLKGGTLQIIGNASNANTQTFASTTFGPGLSIISAAPAAPGDPLPTLALKALILNTSTNLGAAVRYVGPATIGAGNAGVAATGTITTTTAGVAGTPGGLLLAEGPATANPTNAYATVGLYDWASTNLAGSGGAGTSPYTIIGGSQVTNFYDTTAGWTGFTNFDVTSTNTNTIANNSLMTSVRFNDPSAPSLATGGGLMLLFYGLLVTPNMGAANATVSGGGSYQVTRITNPAGGQSGTFWQNNTLGFLNFSPNIIDGRDAGDAVSIIKAGAGTMVLTTGSTYTGQTYVNGGSLVITADSSVGAVAAPGAINLNGGTLFGNATFSLDNNGANKRGITLLGNGGGLAASAGNSMTVSGVVGGAAGTGSLTIGIPASAANANVAGLLPGTGSIASGQSVDTANTTPMFATGAVALYGANTYTGGTTVVGGATLNINGINALGGSNYGGLTLNNGTLQYNAGLGTFTTNGSGDLTSVGIAGLSIASGGGTIDTNGNTVTYAGSIGNGGLGKLTISDSAGTGTLKLAGANNYSGGTLITGGTLNVTNTAGSATGIGPVAITGGTLSGSGIISGALNVSGGTISPGAAGTTLNLGAITLNSGTLGFSLNGVSNTSSQILATSATFNATPTLTVNATGISGGQTYTVFTSATNIAGGSFLSSISPVLIGRTTVTASESANQKSIVLTTTGSSANLIWAGGVGGLATTLAPQGDGSTWNNTQSTSPAASNWNNGGKYDYFYDLDNVTFNDTGSPNQTVNLTTTVSPSSVTVTTAGTYTFQGSGSISGLGALRVTSGTLNLNTASNIYSGGTNISAGAVLVTGASAALPGTGTVTVAGTLDLIGNSQTIGLLADGGASTGVITSSGGSGTLTITTAGISSFKGLLQNGTGNLGLTIAGTGTQILTGSNSYTGATAINVGSALQIGNNSSALSLPSGSTVTDNGTLGFDLSTGTVAVGNAISGTGKLVQNGAAGNILQLNANTYSGGTAINSGTIQLTGATGIGTGDVAVASGANLDLNGLSPTFGAISGAGTIDSSTAGTMTLSIGNTNNAGTFSGAIKNTVGTVNLTKAGTGTQTITGTVGSSATPVGTITDAAGALTINGGTVYAASLIENNATSASSIMVTGNSSVVLTGDLGADDQGGGSNNGYIQLLSGNITANTATIGRDNANTGFPVPATTDGIYVNGATLNITNTLAIGQTSTGSFTNSGATVRLDSGLVTVGGTTVIANIAFQRSATLAINGGTFTSNDTAGNGIQVGGVTGPFQQYAELLVTGGTVNTHTITLGGSAQTISGTDEMVATGGIINIGSGGIVLGGPTGNNLVVNLGAAASVNAPVIAASANWSSAAAITLSNSSTGFPVTFKTADAGGVAHNITLTGALSGTGGLLKTGGGTLSLSGSNTYSGGTNVSAGTLVLNSVNAFPSGTAQAGTSLIVGSGTTVQIANHGTGTTVVPFVSSLTNTGTIDLTNNAMILRSASANIGTISTQVAAAYNGGNWDGSSGSGVITSSTAATDTTHLTAVGIATGLTTFESAGVSSADVLLKYTYYGDANLDGQVDGTDYSRIDSGYLSALTGWYNGDFNYDGVIDGSDYTLIDNAFNTQGAIIASEIAAPLAQLAGGAGTFAVPEPATLGLLGIGAVGLLGRRRRR